MIRIRQGVQKHVIKQRAVLQYVRVVVATSTTSAATTTASAVTLTLSHWTTVAAGKSCIDQIAQTSHLISSLLMHTMA
jgi:hypothetical protein